MGLADGVSRFLMLTAKQNDMEYRAQQISNERLMLSKKIEQIANEYNAKISDRKLFMQQMGTDYQAVNTMSLMERGYQVVETSSNKLYDEYAPEDGTIKKSLEEGLRDGTYILMRPANLWTQQVESIYGLDGNFEHVDWRNIPDIYDGLNTFNDAEAETEYERATQEIYEKDKRLTLDLETMEPEQKATAAELEALKQVIKQNSENSFKTFA